MFYYTPGLNLITLLSYLKNVLKCKFVLEDMEHGSYFRLEQHENPGSWEFKILLSKPFISFILCWIKLDQSSFIFSGMEGMIRMGVEEVATVQSSPIETWMHRGIMMISEKINIWRILHRNKISFWCLEFFALFCCFPRK